MRFLEKTPLPKLSVQYSFSTAIPDKSVQIKYHRQKLLALGFAEYPTIANIHIARANELIKPYTTIALAVGGRAYANIENVRVGPGLVAVMAEATAEALNSHHLGYTYLSFYPDNFLATAECVAKWVALKESALPQYTGGIFEKGWKSFFSRNEGDYWDVPPHEPGLRNRYKRVFKETYLALLAQYQAATTHDLTEEQIREIKKQVTKTVEAKIARMYQDDAEWGQRIEENFDILEPPRYPPRTHQSEGITLQLLGHNDQGSYTCRIDPDGGSQDLWDFLIDCRDNGKTIETPDRQRLDLSRYHDSWLEQLYIHILR